MAALKAWASEDLRSLNGQIEYLLRGALRDTGRLPRRARRHRADADAELDGSAPAVSEGEPSAAVSVPG